MDLNGKVAVVTGGAMGIGAEIAKVLARSGAKVAITDLNAAVGAEMAGSLIGEGREAAYFEQDVTSWDSAFAMAEAVETQLGPIAILVNNAGVSRRVPFLEMSEAEWDRLLDINLKGQFLTARAVIPRMLERDYGRIINMSSVAGKQAAPCFAHYCTSKFGVLGLTQSLAVEFAKTGITVNAVCPGIVATPMHDQLLPEMAKAMGLSVEEAVQGFLSVIPQGRPQTPEDIARMVVFLASDEARNMTGGSYHVDGGIRMG
ncbi:NAD(P)-dependent dehydrogenase (short-subunit alcohol dehydrogenase family) [Sphingomonas vulcanisoli]|uniref:NAD(P)-dependent dehydrogenase (Short-subunit alcohol dehydrogenase family) n=1 Tax=Sphingomonas vulcanisoli TaxID=1658060 RepID=A0ABX0TM36_9SPHN|nr:SDR family NAD(P)-dependent oxidoreductase [Sphingomonas vulcanisoli]NIJ06577.1 NAD(P)-dependent dehydrogenase (short-subunit alcohol dehydrogenase family) [Sphingomonas vulcanisoli]